MISTALAPETRGEGSGCADTVPAAWSETETAVWRDLAAGRAAAPPAGEDLGPFLGDLIACGQLARDLPPAGVALDGARIGALALHHATIPFRLVCRNCAIDLIEAPGSRWQAGIDLGGSRLARGIDLERARIEGDANLAGIEAVTPGDPTAAGLRLGRARFAADLVLDGARVAGPMDLTAATIGGDLSIARAGMLALSLEDASVGGRAILDASLVAGGIALGHLETGGTASLLETEAAGPIDASAARIGGALRLDGARLAALTLESAAIGEHLVLSGATVAGDVDLDKARIGGDLWIRAYEGAPPPAIGVGASAPTLVMSLRNAEIDGRVDISGARFGGELSFDAARIGEDLWLRRGSVVEGPIVAIYARIGQNLDLSGASVGALDATGARIGGEIRLGAPGNATLPPPGWRDGARLTLRNVSASAVVDTIAGTPGSAAGEAPCPAMGGEDDPWPGSIDVIGFSYSRFGGLGGGDETVRARCGWYVDWLARQQPFSLDPYRRLADHLDGQGRATAARQVRWAAKERQLSEAQGLEWVRLFLQKIFVGYGIYSYVVFLWMGAFAAVGALIFSRAPEARESPVPLGFVFSLDMLLPFLSFRRAHGDVDLQGPVRFYLYFHKFMGWVFALFFASALGGLFAV